MFSLPAQVRSRNAVLALVLIWALLLAQWAGFQHRIFHAEAEHVQIEHAAHTAASSLLDIDHKNVHSCAAFDAATLSAWLAIPSLIMPQCTFARTTKLWVAFLSWNAPPAHYFSPRAPPR